jgi:hypothetical protein
LIIESESVLTVGSITVLCLIFQFLSMSEEEFKYPVDLSKIKNNKLFNKFVKSLEKEPSKPKNEEAAAKPIEYNTAYQNKS